MHCLPIWNLSLKKHSQHVPKAVYGAHKRLLPVLACQVELKRDKKHINCRHETTEGIRALKRLVLKPLLCIDSHKRWVRRVYSVIISYVNLWARQDIMLQRRPAQRPVRLHSPMVLHDPLLQQRLLFPFSSLFSNMNELMLRTQQCMR